MISTNKKSIIPISNPSSELIFDMTLINRSRRNRNDFIKFIIAIGVQIEFENASSQFLEINEIGIAVNQEDGKIALYKSNDYRGVLPNKLESKAKGSILLAGSSFQKILSEYKNETAFIYAKCISASGELVYKSNEFIGDGVEEKLEKVKEGDLANWAQEDFVKLDADPIFVSSENI